MNKKSPQWFAILLLPLLLAACANQEQPAAEPAAPPPPVAKPHANMLQLMRALPFIHSNVIFDAQSKDPEGPDKKSSMVYSLYRWGDSDIYAGWPGVESSALAIAETAELLMIPGRLCANGLTAPVEREDWKLYSQGLVTAGEAAYKAAQSKNLDAILEVSETITNACAACHSVYRDVEETGGMRCAVPK